MFAPHIKSVENLPQELLQQMAGNCQQGQYNTVHEALVAYNNRIFLRTNPQERRKSGTRKLKTPYLQPMDASAMNVARNEANKDKRIHDWLLPDIEEESRLLVERVPFQSDKPNKVRPRDKKVEKKMEKMEKSTRAVASAPNALDQVEENGDKRQRISNDGRFLIINVRGHVIKQPNPDHNEVASPSIPDDQSDIVELVDVQDGHGGGSCNSTSITERINH